MLMCLFPPRPDIVPVGSSIIKKTQDPWKLFLFWNNLQNVSVFGADGKRWREKAQRFDTVSQKRHFFKETRFQ